MKIFFLQFKIHCNINYYGRKRQKFMKSGKQRQMKYLPWKSAISQESLIGNKHEVLN